MSLEKLKRYVIVQEFTLTVGRFLLGFKRLFIVSPEIVAPVTTSLSLLSIFQGAISALASCHDGYVTRSLYFLSLSFFLFFKVRSFLETVFVFLDPVNGIVCSKRNREWIINDNRVSDRYVKNGHERILIPMDIIFFLRCRPVIYRVIMIICLRRSKRWSWEV